jgi:hypothetical protein
MDDSQSTFYYDKTTSQEIVGVEVVVAQYPVDEEADHADDASISDVEGVSSGGLRKAVPSAAPAFPRQNPPHYFFVVNDNLMTLAQAKSFFPVFLNP